MLNDPRLFSYVIMCLYVLASARYFWAKDIGHGCYWICACGITATVTFLMGAK